MASLTTERASETEARLRSQRTTLLERIRICLRACGDLDKLALADRLEEGSGFDIDPFAGMDLAEISHERAGLRDTDAALRRLAEGTYGLCSCCGEPIGAKRLQALPATALCLACKEAFKKRRGIA